MLELPDSSTELAESIDEIIMVSQLPILNMLNVCMSTISAEKNQSNTAIQQINQVGIGLKGTNTHPTGHMGTKFPN